MQVLGYILLVGGALFGLVKFYVVYDVARNSHNSGGVPTIDGLIFPPIFITAGICNIVKLPAEWWGVLIWLGITVAFTAIYYLLDYIGHSMQPARDGSGDRPDNHTPEND